MENLNRHTDRDQITSPVGNFITVDEDKLKGVCIVIPQSILAKVPHFNKTSMVLDLKQTMDLLYSLRQSAPNYEEFKTLMQLLMDSQSVKGKNMLIRALKSKVDINVGETTLIKIPQNVLEHLPDSFKAEMMMGKEKAEEAIQCLKIKNPNSFNSLIFRWMAGQNESGLKLLTHANKKSKQALPGAPSVTPSHDQNVLGQSSSRSDPSVSNNELSVIPYHIPNDRCYQDLKRLILEMDLLSKQRQLVSNKVESLIFGILKKSILFDMFRVANMMLKNSEAEASETDKERLIKYTRQISHQYHALNLPNGVSLVAASKRKPLEAYIRETRKTSNNPQISLLHHFFQAPIQTAVTSESHAVDQSALYNQSISSRQNEVNHSRKSHPESISTSGVELKSINVSPYRSQVPVSNVQLPALEVAPSQLMVSAQNEQTQAAGSTSPVLASNTVIVIDSENEEILPPSISNSTQAQRSDISSSICDSSQEKNRRILIDYTNSTEPSNNGEPIFGNEEDGHIHHGKSPNKTSSVPHTDLGLSVAKRNYDFSEEADDCSFISQVRSLNESSSPYSNKKRRSSESIERIASQHHHVDFGWQEGFVEGLFYNLGIESPFGSDDSRRMDQVYLDGFKAASSYYTRKVNE